MHNIGKSILRSHEFRLIVVIIVFALIVNGVNSSFLSAENMFDILKSSSIMGVMAIGVLIVMITGGMDISFPAIATVSSYVTVRLMQLFDGNLYLAFVIASVIGILMGCINGLLVYYFNIPTLIVTLGTSSIFHGLMLCIAKVPHIYTIPGYFFRFSKQNVFSWVTHEGTTIGLSAMTLVLLIIALLTWLLLRYSMLGRGFYALGGNREATMRAGFNIMKIQFFVYAYIGFLSGVASIFYVSLVRHVHPFNLMDMLLNVIAAVVLGGASVNGGKGTVLGTLLGVWLIYLIQNSLILMKIPSYWDPLVIGVVIVVSTGINAYGKRLGRTGVRISEI